MSLFILIPVAFYFICLHVFVKNFIPLPFDAAGQMTNEPGNIMPFFQRLRDMNTELIFTKFGIGSYGFFIYFFCLLLGIDTIWPRRFNREASVALYGVLVVYIGLPFIGYLLPLADLMNTTKRGLFKIFPLMFMYICNSGLLIQLTARIKKWENIGNSTQSV